VAYYRFGFVVDWLRRVKTFDHDERRTSPLRKNGDHAMPRSDGCVYSSLEEEEVLLGQLDAGEQFWLKGDVWEVRAPGQNRMVLCKRFGHADEAMLDVNIVVQPKLQ